MTREATATRSLGTTTRDQSLVTATKGSPQNTERSSATKKKKFFFKSCKTQNGLSVFLSSKGRQNFYQIIIDPFFLEDGGSLGPEKETRQCQHHCSPGFLVLKGKASKG